MRVDLIGRGYECKIFEILLMVDQGKGVTVGHYCVRVHGNIASSRVWVHGTVIHRHGYHVDLVLSDRSQE